MPGLNADDHVEFLSLELLALGKFFGIRLDELDVFQVRVQDLAEINLRTAVVNSDHLLRV